MSLMPNTNQEGICMKKHFRLLSICLTIAVLLCSLPLPFPVNAASLDDLSYTISNGEVTITGCDTSASGELVIPDTIEGYPITGIASAAFQDCDQLVNISMPESITKIETFAFQGCSNLISITIPGKVKTIQRLAFHDCRNLIEVVIAEGVECIGESAFGSCGNLKRVSLPSSLTNIDSFAFGWCTSLTEIIIPDNVVYIGNEAFYGCSSLANVSMGNAVEQIGDAAFAYTDLTSINISNSVLSIGCSCFQGCVSLKEVCLPNNIKSISDGCFSGCENLQKITLPDSISKIGRDAFNYCINLSEISFPVNVCEIGAWAFSHCTKIANVTITKRIEKLGDGAFNQCTALKKIYYQGTPSGWQNVDIGNDVFPWWISIVILNSDILTYDANGGTNAPAPSEESFSSVIISSQVPVRENYIFLGWSTCADGEVKYQPGDEYSFELGCTLYAVWGKECVVTYDANGGENAPDAQTQMSFVPFQISDQTPTFPGVSNAFMVWCKGWSTERNGDIEYLPGGTYTIEDDITLYAVWHIRCSDCYGFGGHDVGCTDCGGTGNGEYCPNCMSNGWLGWETCGFCNGTCRITYDCPNCDGPYGYFWCTCDHGEINEYCGECTNGEVPILCPDCDGDGYFDCDSCSGDGIVFQPNSCVTCTGSGSVLYIPSVVTGDLNDDNSVNEDDAIYLLQHVLLPDIFTVSQNVDYNKDGTIDEDDAIYLLQHVLLPDLFPIS